MISPGVVKTGFATRARKGNQEAVDNLFKNAGYLESKDIADSVVFILKQAPNANVCDIIVRPRVQVN